MLEALLLERLGLSVEAEPGLGARVDQLGELINHPLVFEEVFQGLASPGPARCRRSQRCVPSGTKSRQDACAPSVALEGSWYSCRDRSARGAGKLPAFPAGNPYGLVGRFHTRWESTRPGRTLLERNDPGGCTTPSRAEDWERRHLACSGDAERPRRPAPPAETRVE